VDIGEKPPRLTFNAAGGLESGLPAVINIPLPILLRIPPFGSVTADTIKGWAMAAKRLGTLLAVPEEKLTADLGAFAGNLIPVCKEAPAEKDGTPVNHPMREITANAAAEEGVEKRCSGTMPVVRLPVREGVEKRAAELVAKGVSVLFLEGSPEGAFLDDPSRALKDGIRAVHLKLIAENVRDRVTLLAGGGLAMAEHVAKAIICGADAVTVDLPLLVALECRMCRRCLKGLSCPVRVEEAPPEWVALRTVNLLGAWHNQLLEVMGAMGIRDARRLRGEVGRAMFFEDLDESTFGSLGELKEGYELE
jgi:hypothetical protein